MFFQSPNPNFVKEFNFNSTDEQFVYNWARFKTYIQDNVHRSVVVPTNPPSAPPPSTTLAKADVIFAQGNLYNTMISGNSTEGNVDLFASNCHIVGNNIYGYREILLIERSIFLDTSGVDNIVTSNVTGWDVFVSAVLNAVGNNRQI